MLVRSQSNAKTMASKTLSCPYKYSYTQVAVDYGPDFAVDRESTLPTLVHLLFPLPRASYIRHPARRRAPKTPIKVLALPKYIL
jgi:hypothetical protein